MENDVTKGEIYLSAIFVPSVYIYFFDIQKIGKHKNYAEGGFMMTSRTMSPTMAICLVGSMRMDVAGKVL